MTPPAPASLQIFLNLSAAHYPERLGTFFIVSAPTVFNTLWRAISRFIDPVTKQKVRARVASRLLPLARCSRRRQPSLSMPQSCTQALPVLVGLTYPGYHYLIHSPVCHSCPANPQIHFVDFKSKKDNGKLEGLLARYFDAATCHWLLREMEDNRNKGLAVSKAYSYPDLRWGARCLASLASVARFGCDRRNAWQACQCWQSVCA